MSVEVKLELGHRAVMREKVTQEGFTHDWNVFVRGAEGNDIKHFVEKVVFHLHESFPKPKRVVKEPPYSVAESGYAGFIMPIEVYFRTREEPKKVTFKYDLYLRLEQPPVSNIRIEKLTFQNPSDDFRCKLLKAGGIAGPLTGSAAVGGSASLSTQACAPPQHVEDHQPPNHPKPSIAEKKPRSHVPSKELPSKPSQPNLPKPSQPFTDIFGAPIRTKSSPDSSSVKSKDSGHSSQPKNKIAPNSSSGSSANKEVKASIKESHKSKSSHSKESRNTAKEIHQSPKDSHPPKDTHNSSKETHPSKDSHPQSKDLHPQSKDSHSSKEGHKIVKDGSNIVKENHSKEGHKIKDSHHPPKESKTSSKAASQSSESKDQKPSKSVKPDKDSNKVSSLKRPPPADSHSSHGNVEKKKKSSPVSSENSDKSNSHSKQKTKEGKEKTEKHKAKPHSSTVKKPEEKIKHKSSPAPMSAPISAPISAPVIPVEPPKEVIKPKLSSPIKAASPIVKPLSPIIKLPSPDSSSMYSDSDESHRSYYNKAEYSSPASSISESSLRASNPLSGIMSDHSILSPLSDDDDDEDDFSSAPKRKISNEFNLDDGCPDPKRLETKSMPKLKKKHHVHHKSYKSKSSNSYHRGNGSINNDIPLHHSPVFEDQNTYNANNSAYRKELYELQKIIMNSNDSVMLQNIVDLIEKTGKYEITNTTFDFDLCSLDPTVIQKIKLYVANCEKFV